MTLPRATRSLQRSLILVGLLSVAPACATVGRTAVGDGGPGGDATNVASDGAMGDGALNDAAPFDGGLCVAPEVWCNGACLDVSDDNANCGGCGAVCPSAGDCVAGECVVNLSGSLSGRVSYPNARVVLTADVHVTPYNGSDDVSECDVGETGCLHLEARVIVVSAGVSITAAGAGYGGGGGGGGGTGQAGPSASCNGCTSCSVGTGGPGIAGGAPGDSGTIGTGSSISGGGGDGGGPFGGNGAPSRQSAGDAGPVGGTAGGAGGYATAGGNGDTSTDESLRMGSGGGGGSGGACAMEPWYSSVGGSGGGGAGNRGGGYIKLVATERVEVTGSLHTAGLANASGNGGNGTDGYNGGVRCDLEGSGGDGGSAWDNGSSAGGNGVAGYFQSGYEPCIDRTCEDNGSHAVTGGHGGGGGAGAGGGVLLKAPEVALTGSIDAAGGLPTTNGGTVKIFHQGVAPPTATIAAGRIHVQPY